MSPSKSSAQVTFSPLAPRSPSSPFKAWIDFTSSGLVRVSKGDNREEQLRRSQWKSKGKAKTRASGFFSSVDCSRSIIQESAPDGTSLRKWVKRSRSRHMVVGGVRSGGFCCLSGQVSVSVPSGAHGEHGQASVRHASHSDSLQLHFAARSGNGNCVQQKLDRFDQLVCCRLSIGTP